MFNKYGLLAPGLHEMTLDEIKDYFGTFQRTDRRPRLFAKFHEFRDAVAAMNADIALVIDGSFIMRCVDDPDDIDLLLILPERWDFSEDLPPFRYNVVSKRAVKRQFGFDMFVAKAGTATEATYLNFSPGST